MVYDIQTKWLYKTIFFEIYQTQSCRAQRNIISSALQFETGILGGLASAHNL